MKYSILFLALFYALKSNAQELNKSINNDSLFYLLTKKLPNEIKNELINQYRSASNKDKEALLFIATMPRSSKTLLKKNLDTNYIDIMHLKMEYSKLVPENYTVSIEFEPANNIFNVKESIDLKITKVQNKETTVSQEWNMTNDSGKLKEMLKTVKWNEATLRVIKKLLDDANCISIENGEMTTIGFARSGLGMYSYVIFDKDLNAAQVKNHNDGCNFIFYKKNVVFEYEGGAAGPQCFPDSK